MTNITHTNCGGDIVAVASRSKSADTDFVCLDCGAIVAVKTPCCDDDLFHVTVTYALTDDSHSGWVCYNCDTPYYV